MIYIALAAIVAALLLALLAARLGLFDDKHLCEVCFDADAAARLCRGCANRAAGFPPEGGAP